MYLYTIIIILGLCWHLKFCNGQLVKYGLKLTIYQSDKKLIWYSVYVEDTKIAHNQILKCTSKFEYRLSIPCCGSIKVYFQVRTANTWEQFVCYAY